MRRTPSSSGEWTAGGYLTSGDHLLTFWVEERVQLLDAPLTAANAFVCRRLYPLRYGKIARQRGLEAKVELDDSRARRSLDGLKMRQ